MPRETRPRPAQRSCSSAAPTSASPRSSTASPDSRRAIVTRDRRDDARRHCCSRRSGRRLRSRSSTPAGCSAPARIRSTTRGHRTAGGRSKRPTSSSSSSMDARGWCPATRRSPRRSRTSKAPVLMAVNKTDDKRARGRALEFYELGFEPVVEIAAEHGDGVGDLLDEVVARLPARARARTAPTPRGNRGRHRRPAERRQVVAAQSAAAGRALDRQRDAGHDARHGRRGAEVAQADVPHRRHRGHPAARPRGALAASSSRSASSSRGGRSSRRTWRCSSSTRSKARPTRTRAIAGEAEKAGCGIIIAANKWDLMKGRGADFSKTFDDELRRQLKFLDYAPILHISATTGERTPKVLETIDKVAEARTRRVPTGELNRFVAAVTAVHPPASPGPPRGARSSTRRRPASRRRRSCSSRTSRPSSTSPTSGFW